MNGILGFLDLLNDDHLLEKDKKAYIEVVNKSGNRLLSTINDVIEISRIESCQISLSISAVNINETMAYLHQFFKKQADAKKLKLILSEATPSVELIIKTDRSLLEGILMNLIKNAIKFTTEGSIEFGYYLENKNLLFYVKDTGCGIPADRHDAIFERFVQSDISMTRAHEGSGLGLAIVKSYIELLNGKVWLESEINKGSTFYFNIPYVKQA
jgi:signal transduction histidine kinase